MADEVKVLIGGENSEAVASIAQVREVLQGLTSPLRAVRDNLGEVAEAFVAAFAVEKIERFIERMTEMGAAVEHATHELGMSAEQISTLNSAFAAMGLGSEGAIRALERLEYNMSNAAREATGPAALAFKALGLSMAGLRTMSPEQVLELLADKFSSTADGANKTAIAIALLGRSGAEMIPFLDAGRAGLEEFNRVAQQTGTIWSEEQAGAAERTSIAISTLGQAFDGLGKTVYESVEPVIDRLVNDLIQLVEWLNNALQPTGELSGAFQALATALDTVVRACEDVFNFLRVIGDALDVIARYADLAGADLHKIFTFGGGAEQQTKAVNALSAALEKLKADTKTLLALGGPGSAAAGSTTSTGNVGIGSSQSAGLPQLPTLGGSASKDQQESMLQQWREALQQRLIDEGNFFKSSQAEELAYWQSKLATVKEYEAQYGLTEKQAQQLHLQVQTEIFNLDKAQAQQWLAAYKEGITEQEDALKTDLASKEISESAYYTRSVALANDWANLMAQIYTRDSAQYRQALAQKEQLDRQHAAQSEQVWQKAASTIESAFDGMLRGVLQGTQTWQQAMDRLVGNLVIAFVEQIAKLGIEWAVKQAKRLLLEQTTDDEILASHELTNAASSASDASLNIGPSVLKHAGSAAAAVFDDVAQIPYVGWVLAPPAAAAAFAAVAAFGSFDIGAWSLPSDMIAQVHQGEMIIPAGVANLIRGGGSVTSFASGMAGAGGGAGGMQFNYSPSFQSWDTAGLQALVNRHGQIFARTVAQQLQRNPSLRGAY